MNRLLPVAVCVGLAAFHAANASDVRLEQPIMVLADCETLEAPELFCAGELVAIFLDDGPSPGTGAASSVVDLRDGTLRVLREGALTLGTLESALHDRKAPPP
jgi:hypothetical protein